MTDIENTVVWDISKCNDNRLPNNPAKMTKTGVTNKAICKVPYNQPNSEINTILSCLVNCCNELTCIAYNWNKDKGDESPAHPKFVNESLNTVWLGSASLHSTKDSDNLYTSA